VAVGAELPGAAKGVALPNSLGFPFCRKAPGRRGCLVYSYPGLIVTVTAAHWDARDVRVASRHVSARSENVEAHGQRGNLPGR